jgi:hypothetical protein
VAVCIIFNALFTDLKENEVLKAHEYKEAYGTECGWCGNKNWAGIEIFIKNEKTEQVRNSYFICNECRSNDVR